MASLFDKFTFCMSHGALLLKKKKSAMVCPQVSCLDIICDVKNEVIPRERKPGNFNHDIGGPMGIDIQA